MTTLISELYDALRDAGATEEKSRKAAEAVAAFDSRFARIETDLTLLKWMVGGVYVVLIPAGWLVLRIAFKVGAVT